MNIENYGFNIEYKGEYYSRFEEIAQKLAPDVNQHAFHDQPVMINKHTSHHLTDGGGGIWRLKVLPGNSENERQWMAYVRNETYHRLRGTEILNWMIFEQGYVFEDNKKGASIKGIINVS